MAQTLPSVFVSHGAPSRTLVTVARTGDRAVLKAWEQPIERDVGVLSLDHYRPQDLAWSPDGKHLAAAGYRLRLWEVAGLSLGSSRSGSRSL